MQRIKPEDKDTEVLIILKDEEIEPIIRDLIAKANEKGYCKTNLTKAIITRWDEKYQDSKPVFAPTSEELEYWEKVDKFVEQYKDLLIESHDKCEDDERMWIKGDERLEDYFLKRVKLYLHAAYCVFCREDNIRQAHVIKYANRIESCSLATVSEIARAVYRVMYTFLEYDESNGYKPEIRGSKEGLKPLIAVKEADEFCDSYKYTHTRFSDGMMTAIWFITSFM